MRVLLTNVQLNQRTGTEIVVRDLDAGLRRRGHEVCIYTPAPGEIAAEITASGGTVVADLARVPFEPDVIHGHHHLETSEALVRFPTAAAIFVCHDRTSPNDIPPRTSRIGRYVSVDLNCDERLALEGGIPEDRRSIIHNAVDLSRHRRRGPLPSTPRRAMVLSNNATQRGYVDRIRSACAARGIELDVFGSGVDAILTTPEAVLVDYDVVFAKARSALEALAVGCAVVVTDLAGTGGLVVSGDVASMRDWNFGARCLQAPVTSDRIALELDRYDPADAMRVTDWIRENADLDRAVEAYEELYRAVMADPRPGGPPTTWAELHRSLLEHAGTLEGVLREVDGASVAREVPPSACAQIHARLEEVPLETGPGVLMSVDIEVRNESVEALSSAGPTPVHLAYRWSDSNGARVGGEPERTPLVARVGPGEVHRQSLRVRAPDASGTFVLRPDLVQEGRFWFGDVTGFEPASLDVRVTPERPDGRWTLGRVAGLASLDVVRDGAFAELGFATADVPAMLTFGESPEFVARAVRNPATSCVIVPGALVDLVPPHIAVAVTGHPRVAFTRIHELLATRTDFYGTAVPTAVHPTAIVHPTAHVDTASVLIGPGVTIGPNASLTGRVDVRAGAVIGPGVVLGSHGFQTVLIGGVPTEMVHAGGVTIGVGAVVFANAMIARGLFRRDTVVGDGARVGNGAFVSHNTVVGPRSFVGHGSVINGNVEIGADSWIGPGATVTNNISLGEGCRVSLGATVFGDVAPGEHVSGLAAVDHRTALRASAELRRRR